MADQRAAAVKDPPAKGKVTRIPAAKKWTIGEVEYVQDELTFLEKNELFSILSTHIQDAIDSGVDLTKLMTLFTAAASVEGDSEVVMQAIMSQFGKMRPEDVATDIGNLILQFFTMFPKIVPDIYALALSVPEEDVDEFKKALRTVNDEVGFGIAELFVHQNPKALMDFGKRWRGLYTTLLSSTS